MSIASHHAETPAADASRLLIRLGLAILLVALPILTVALRGAIYVLMPVGAIVVLIGAAIGAPDHGPRHLRTALVSPGGLAAVFLTFWAAMSLLWTPFPGEAGQRFAQIVGTTLLVALVAAYLPARTRPFDLYLLPVGVALGALAVLILAFRAHLPFGRPQPFDDQLFERSMITLIVLVWPALGALCLRERWIYAAILALLAAGVALAGFAQAGLAAMGAAAFVFAMAMSEPVRLAHRLGLVVAALILFAPVLALVLGALIGMTLQHPNAAAQSILVWREIILAEWPRLFTGHGFDAANRTAALGYLPEQTPGSLLFVIWYDLGIIGAAGFAFLTAQIFLITGKIPTSIAPSVLAGLTAIFVMAMLGAAAAQIWWVTLIDCAVIAYIVLIKGIYRSQRPAAPGAEGAADLDDARFDAASARGA
ncbi:conserved hypothetical protein [Methylocella silvestris BL2]|uniref:Peptide ABC transporter permease n=1 Tax=Methylocella silvestris (strain DSM 15510 / CIP 108128 / LMG 27833 / NCIMB 13906 / BL2) TaxID=395965 RepID=B8ELK2_METSB|nr:hypothetical protein [Methylocella silvestris]ACK49996.1 conserved hypothetical protein [Methylocella silvestris BL2]